MITRTQAAGATPLAAERVSRGARQSASDFSELVRRSAAESKNDATAAPPGRQNTASITGAQIAATVASPDAQPAAEKAAAPDQAGLPYAFSREAIENHMNQWLMGLTQRQNDVRMQNYNNAVEGWKNVNARNRELGLPEIPPPPPPDLAAVAPMPAGWWFETHS